MAVWGLMLALFACTPGEPQFRAIDISGVTWGSDFELTAQHGERLNTADFRGKILLLYFGYSHCPDICVPTLARLAEVRRKLGPLGYRVQVFFITVDPLHDTPRQLADFLARFDSSFIGLTGTPAEVEAVAQDYKVKYQAEAGLRHTAATSNPIEHSGGVFVRDASGQLRLYMREGASADDMLHDLRLLLGQMRVH